jgi:hypothetical protein
VRRSAALDSETLSQYTCSMKRSLGKTAALVFWFVGPCGAVLFSCWWMFAMVYTRKANLGTLSLLALGVAGAWHGFKMFRTERSSS